MLPKYFVTLTILLLSGVGAIAQEVPDAPSITIGTFPGSPAAGMSRAEANFVSGAPSTAKGPWINPSIADMAYWNTTAVLVGTTVLNVEMTVRCSERGTCLQWIAGGTASGSTRLRLYAYTLPVDAALSYLTYRWKPKHRWWMVPSAAVSGANLFSAGRSYGRLQIDPAPPR